MKDYLARLQSRIEQTDQSELFSPWVLFWGCVVVYLQHAWLPGFFQDGYLYASLGKNAAELGHWLVPYQSETQFKNFAEHPPLVFILEGIFFKIFGSDFTQARLFSGMWGIFCVLGIFAFLKCRRDSRWAYYAGFILLASPSFIKKVRFPGLDIPLTFFFILALYFYYLAFEKSEEKNTRQWLLSGLCFGIALWIKGLPALFIPMIVFIHLAVTGKLLRELSKPGAYLGLMLGLGLFALWPLSLKMAGKYQVFEAYINRQLFGTVVKSRGQTELDLLVYVVHLVKFSFPWLVFAGISAYFWRKKSPKDPLFLLFLVWFLALLVPLSFMKFKYSHYILPLYPALAGMAAYVLSLLPLEFHRWSNATTKGLVILGGAVLLVFPVTHKSSRHPELLQVEKRLRLMDEKPPKTWIVVNNAYPYWAVSGFSSYRFGANPKWLHNPTYLTREPAIIFISSEDLKKYKLPYWQKLYSRGDLHVGITKPFQR